MRLNLGIRRRLAPLLDGDPQKILLLNAVLFSLPGTPIIYYGDEIGMGDNIYLEDRNGLRTPMQWNNRKNAGFLTAAEDNLYVPVIKKGIFSYQNVNVLKQQKDAHSLFNTMRKMIAIRRENAVFAVGKCDFIVNRQYPALLFPTRTNEEDTILALHNLSELAIPINLSSYLEPSQKLVDLMKVEIFTLETFTLSAYSFIWLKFSKEPESL